MVSISYLYVYSNIQFMTLVKYSSSSYIVQHCLAPESLKKLGSETVFPLANTFCFTPKYWSFSSLNVYESNQECYSKVSKPLKYYHLGQWEETVHDYQRYAALHILHSISVLISDWLRAFIFSAECIKGCYYNLKYYLWISSNSSMSLAFSCSPIFFTPLHFTLYYSKPLPQNLWSNVICWTRKLRWPLV